MDGYISILFVSEDTPLGNIVKSVTGSIWSHVGIIAYGCIVEAIQPRVIASPLTRYTNCLAEQIDYYVPDIAAAMAELRTLIGAPYGWIECIKGGLKDTLGVTLPAADDHTVNCCELVVRMIRAGGGEIGTGTPADCFTPGSLFTAAKMNVIGRG